MLKQHIKKNWVITERKYDDVIDQLLYNRGIVADASDVVTKDRFLDPNYEDGLNDPSLLPDLEKANERIIKARSLGESIGIFADYDADGVPGAALLFRILNKIGIRTQIYIPSRAIGYGLNREGIDYLAKQGCKLIISVDLGIRNIEEADYCAKKGIDLIITDHHLPGETLPQAFAIVNPKVEKNVYPYPDLCGCGLVYKLAQALSLKVSELPDSFLRWNLDLVALSTISDMVPLLGENRVLAKYGLLVLRKTKNLGIRAICKTASIALEKIDPYVVGFQIGPRINTPGRIDHASKSFDLLITEDKEKSEQLAEWLNQKNAERQKLMDDVFAEAVLQIEEQGLATNKIIIVAGKWDRGVLGPPASRLVERYHRPVIVLAEAGDELVGSARSIPGVNITKLFEQAREVIYKFGGHSGAAGLTVKTKIFSKFVAKMVELSNQEIKPSLLHKQIKIDAVLNSTILNLEFYKMIEKMEPFGVGNPRPIFMLEGIEIANHRFVGEGGKHLSMMVKYGRQIYKAIYFNCDQEALSLKSELLYDIVFTVSTDTWKGKTNLSLMIIDLRTHVKEE